ncbi:MAG: alpha-galactosidase [Terriglobia bacterium]
MIRREFLSATLAAAVDEALAGTAFATAELVKPEDVRQDNPWAKEKLPDFSAKMPFSFVYGGQASDKVLASCSKKTHAEKLDAQRRQRTITWSDSKTGLEVRCVAVDYTDYPAIEWTVYFRNNGTSKTPILEDIQGLDVHFEGSMESEFILNGIKGDWCTEDSYQPYQLTLFADTVKEFAPASSGKSCDGPSGWPYYNLQMPGGGVILALGWPGQWSSSFERDNKIGLKIKAGQELAHLFLKPGEEVRTPLIAMLAWRGKDIVASQNLWRRWIIAHNMPPVNGQVQSPIAQIQVDGADIGYVKTILEAGIKPDICWRDAAWYPRLTGPYKGGDSWLNTGTWEIDPMEYPQGFRPFSDWVHAHGMKFLLWFEPERVGDPNSWLGKNHPEWLLPGTSHGSLLNEGNPAALNWLINHIDGMIKSQGIDWYREDMNGVGPLPAWRKNDADDRQGITENFYVQGHLAFWDELKRRNPGLRIDSCASGGRRNDLETMRRAVPLLRSDFQWPTMKGVVEGNQGHTYGLSSWLPFQGTGTYFYDAYSSRSFYLPSFGMGGLTPDNAAAQAKAYRECSKIAPYMLGDYFPLTPYSLQLEPWIAWQFHRQELGGGVVQAFRRNASQVASMTFRLNGLDPAAQYEITNFDAEGPAKASGKELMEKGLTVEIEDKPGAAVIVYQAQPKL